METGWVSQCIPPVGAINDIRSRISTQGQAAGGHCPHLCRDTLTNNQLGVEPTLNVH